MTFNQRRKTGLFLAALLTAAACAGDDEPAPLAVEVSGCRRLLPGPGCLLDTSRELRFLVTSPADGPFTVSTSQGSLVFTETASGNGHLLSSVAPQGARSVTVASSSRTFTLVLTEPTPLMLRVRKGQQSGDLIGAQNAIKAALGQLSGADKARALSELGRVFLASGQLPSAERNLKEAAALHASLKHEAEACDDLLVLAYMQLQHHGDYAESRRLLEEASRLAVAYPDGLAHIAYFRGLVAASGGDTRSGLRALQEADTKARRLGFTKLVRATGLQTAQIYQQLGKFQEMFVNLAAAGNGDESVSGCQSADWQTSQAWALLMAAEAGEAVMLPQSAGKSTTASATELLTLALAQYDSVCPESPNRDSALINAALDAFAQQDLAGAKARLASIKETSITQSLPVALWWHDLQGRIAHKEGRFGKALLSYQALEKVAIASATPEANWRAAWGKARAYRALGQPRRAAAAFATAERLADDERFWVPVSEGRGSFSALRQSSAREWVDLLLQEGQQRQAMAVSRRAIRRATALSVLPEKVSHLSGTARDKWESAMETYRKESAAIAKMAAHDWELSQVQRAAATVERKPHVQRMLAALDDALLVLGPRADTSETSLREPELGELMIVYFQTTTGWVAFAAASSGVTSVQLPTVNLNGSAKELGEALLAPLAKHIVQARTISIIASGPLKAIDFHALPLGAGDATLIAQAPVVYLSDLPEAKADAGVAAGALVLADTRGDLPAAALEGQRVADILRPTRVTHLFNGRQTGRQDAIDALVRTELFHYAGHALQSGPANLQSGLPFASGENLEIGDILALPHVPSEIILSGCSSASPGADGLGEGVGLAQAFLLAGAAFAVATNRPVRDEHALPLLEAYHRRVPGENAEAALRRAQLLIGQQIPGADWAAFRIIKR